MTEPPEDDGERQLPDFEAVFALGDEGVTEGFVLNPAHPDILIRAEGEDLYSPAWTLRLARAAYRALVAAGFGDDAALLACEVMSAAEGAEFIAIMSYVEVAW